MRGGSSRHAIIA